MMRNFAPIAVAATMLAAGAAPAMAHAMLMPETAVTGKEIDASFTIGHCDGSPTIEVRVALPEGFVLTGVPALEDWTVETSAAPTTIVYWRGGSVPDDGFEEFFITGKAERPGTLLFPLTQTCANGGSVEWAGPAGSSDRSAPTLLVEAAEGSGGADDLEISGGFTRATLPKAPVGGGYLTITNHGDVDERLVGASSPAAARVELHEMRLEGEVMKMMPRTDGIAIPAGEEVTLAPGGLHIMFIELAEPFVEGASVPVTLQFEKAGDVEVMLPVGEVGAETADPGHGH